MSLRWAIQIKAINAIKDNKRQFAGKKVWSPTPKLVWPIESGPS